MKLIKINTDHYIIVDDSEIKEKSGDWFYSFETGKIYDTLIHHTAASCKKITHSTDIEFNEVYYIPLSEVKELIGEVDVEKKVRNEMGIPDYLPTNSMSPPMQGSLEFGIKCYNQALEDNKDKKYTEEDMMEAMLKICEYYADSVGSGGVIDGYKTANQIIQSLQPKTSWDVQINFDGKLELIK